MTKFVPEHIRSTLRIDPTQFSSTTSPNRMSSFIYALAGLLHMFRYAKNVRIQAAATLVVCLMGFWLKVGRIEWVLLVHIIALNWFAEFVNAAIEAAVNLASPEQHPMAQIAKDIAAGSVLVMTIAAILTGLLILGPPFWERVF